MSEHKPTLFMEKAFAETNPVTTNTPSVCSAGAEVRAFYLPVKRVVSVVKLPVEGFHLFSEISASISFLTFGTILSFAKLYR